MSDKPETIADIIAEMRKRCLPYAKSDSNDARYVAHLCYREFSDRLEAAHEREKEAAERHKPGNAAKLREALEDSQSLLESFLGGEYGAQVREQMRDNCAALAAPARNCDRFNSGDPVKDADDACAEWQRWCDDADMPPSCKIESAFRQWLFATAKPNAKGATDGSK